MKLRKLHPLLFGFIPIRDCLTLYLLFSILFFLRTFTFRFRRKIERKYSIGISHGLYTHLHFQYGIPYAILKLDNTFFGSCEIFLRRHPIGQIKIFYAQLLLIFFYDKCIQILSISIQCQRTVTSSPTFNEGMEAISSL